MEQQNQTAQPVQASPAPTPVQTSTPIPPVAPQPSTAPQAPPSAPQQAPPPPNQPKSNPWPWIVGGCLMIIILIAGTIIFIGWLGARKIKKEIQNSQPMETFKNSLEKMDKESDEWKKKSEEFRNSLPDAEEFEQEMQENYPVQK